VLLALSQAHAADVVLDWNRVAGTAPVVASFGGPYQQFRGMAIVQIAVHDALNSIDRRYHPYSAGLPTASGSASADAAVAAANRYVLLGDADAALAGLIPMANTAARDAVTNAYIAALAAIPDGAAEDAGVAAGRAAAVAILTNRLADGSGSPHSPGYNPGVNPAAGVYLSTAPFGSAPPMFSNWSATRPFVVQSATQFHLPPGEIFVLSSDAYTREYNQVKDLGDARERGAKPNSPQSDIARFWYHGGVDWQANARLILPGFSLDAWDQARALALMSVSVADAGLANATSKYAYAFWRPVTAIRAADDGNPDTEADPNWLPFLTTPPYPDYPCGSTGAAGGATGALRLVLGTNHAPFTRTVNVPALPLANQAWPAGLPSVPAKAIERSFQSLSHAANEVGRSRVYSGIHFLEGCQAGVVQGEMTAEYIYARIMQPVE
jgi:hypothetical protein